MVEYFRKIVFELSNKLGSLHAALPSTVTLNSQVEICWLKLIVVLDFIVAEFTPAEVIFFHCIRLPIAPAGED